MATGTLTPSPWQTVLDANGHPVSGALITTYAAGTTSALSTYTDVGLTVANTNPIVADGSGRYVAFLPPGQSFKFVVTDSGGNPIRTQDNIVGGAGTLSTDVAGTAGQNLTAGQAVYLSDGSGGKTAGLWYPADATNAYSSTLTDVGLAPAAISSGTSGTIRLSGSLTGLTALTVGATYYIGTAGALTTTAPANRRLMAQADTTTSLVIQPAGASTASVLSLQAVSGRLTLTTATPVTTADVTAATTLYFTPYEGNTIPLYDGVSSWTNLTFAELSIAVPATTSQLYDVWVYSNAGVAALELTAWTNDTTRATALALQNGVLVKTGATTRRYVGSFRTTTVSGQTEDSIANRFVWNYYHRVSRLLQRLETTASWNYTTATIRQANGSALNQVNFVVGVNEDPVTAQVIALPTDTGAAAHAVAVGIGLDSTTVMLSQNGSTEVAGNNGNQSIASYTGYAGVGKHSLMWLEWSQAAGTTTWYGNSAPAGWLSASSGITGVLQG
jgi:hypothetical protein